MKYIFTCVTACLACVPFAVSSQQTPTFKSSRDVLTIEASVRDSAGRPVTDLQPADFLVNVDGQPRQVLDAQLFSNDANRVTAGGVPLPRFAQANDATPGRVVIVAVDRDSVRSGSEQPILETASAMLKSLSPADAVGAIGLPVGGTEPTRDHAKAAAAIRLLTGTQPPTPWRYWMSWAEAIDFEQRQQFTIEHVVERECRAGDGGCPAELSGQARDMLHAGRAHAASLLARLTDLLGALETIRAPKHLVLLSGGLPFDMTLLSRYRDVARKAAQSRVAIFVVHLDQPRGDAAEQFNAVSVFGREYATGLGNIAAMTGGLFVNGVGNAKGAFDRIVTDINYFYQLGVEARPSDADGRPRRVEVRVSRPNLSVRAPSLTAAMPAPKSGDAMTRALSQPTDVAGLPLEVATYSTHATESAKVRVLVSATVAPVPGLVPAEWGYLVLDGEKVVGGVRDRIAPADRQDWRATASVDLPVGRYRIRTALISEDGRVGSVDLPLNAGLRAAGDVLVSDLLLGAPNDGRLSLQPRLERAASSVAMIELSSSQPLAGTTGVIELIRAGTTRPQLREDLLLDAREGDATVVVAKATLDLSALDPGTYMASAVLDKNGKPFARVSRLVEVVGGPALPTAAASDSTAPAVAPPSTAARDPVLAELLQRVGKYVDGYGEQASLIVGVEHYEQRYPNAPLGEPPGRKLVAEIVLVRTRDAIGWVGFRDVLAVDGTSIRDRQDRLQSLFQSGTPDLAEARRIADESARYNIGPVRRNFNEPTTALLFLRSSNQQRFEFTRKGTATIGGLATTAVDFRETAKPTVIRTSEGRDVQLEGTFWVDPATGTIVRTRLAVRGFAGLWSSASVAVTFAHDERLGLWLPATMEERIEGPSRRLTRALVTSTATYDTFKRFETSTSISIKH